jgi:hypothetical protein
MVEECIAWNCISSSNQIGLERQLYDENQGNIGAKIHARQANLRVSRTRKRCPIAEQPDTAYHIITKESLLPEVLL